MGVESWWLSTTRSMFGQKIVKRGLQPAVVDNHTCFDPYDTQNIA